MKNKNIKHEREYENTDFEFYLQKDRINKILEETIYKLKLLTHLPSVLENDGEILRKYLNKTEADFVVLVCQEQAPFTRQMAENRSDLIVICNMLEKINMYEKKAGSTAAAIKRAKSFYGADHFDIHVAYAVDIIFKCRPLVEFMETLEDTPDSLMTAFLEAMMQLQKIVDERLSISASEEVKKESELKTAYRSSMMLSNNIQELEDQLEKQRQELGQEHDRKEQILQDLADKIEKLKEKSKKEINRIVYDSEIVMMKDYNKSIELQEELAEEAKEVTEQYDSLLQQHLEEEKVLRAKRLKVEAQLASWVAKYDQDIGEKQAEIDELEKTYNEEREEYEALQEKFDEQQDEYYILMREKEEEEQRIYEEKAWIFLQNRAARRIQRAWRAYRARKLARKKRKGKKRGGSAGRKGKKSPKGKGKGGKAKAKGKEKGKGKKKKQFKEEKEVLKPDEDPNAFLQDKFRGSILGEIKSKEAFDKRDVVVDLND